MNKILQLCLDNAKRERQVINMVRNEAEATVYIYDVIDPYWGVSAKIVIADIAAASDATVLHIRINCDKSKFRNFAISCAVLLAGCATAPAAPVRVEVPVMVPCVGEVPQRPDYEFDKLPTTATDGEIILALARDWIPGRKYEGKLEAIIAGCR